MQDSFSRYAPRGSGLSLCRSLFNARLGSSSGAAAAAAAAASLTKRRFSKSPSVLTITRVSSYPWCETRQGSKIPLGDYFSLATLLPSRLSTLHLSLPLYPTCPFYQQGRILQIWNTFPRETFASRFYPHDFVAIFTFVLEPTEDRVSGVGV